MVDKITRFVIVKNDHDNIVRSSVEEGMLCKVRYMKIEGIYHAIVTVKDCSMEMFNKLKSKATEMYEVKEYDW